MFPARPAEAAWGSRCVPLIWTMAAGGWRRTRLLRSFSGIWHLPPPRRHSSCCWTIARTFCKRGRSTTIFRCDAGTRINRCGWCRSGSSGRSCCGYPTCWSRFRWDESCGRAFSGRSIWSGAMKCRDMCCIPSAWMRIPLSAGFCPALTRPGGPLPSICSAGSGSCTVRA